MIEKLRVVGPFQCNCRLFICPKTKNAFVVDPGDQVDELLKMIDDAADELGDSIHVQGLFHTHAHLDHIGATADLREALMNRQKTAPIVLLHQDDLPLYQQLKMQRELFGIPHLKDAPEVNQYFEHEEIIKCGELKIEVIHTPGHSPGSVCLRLHEDSDLGVSETLLSGDTLFKQSVGRTDLWGASEEQMMKSIRDRILSLDGDTRVCPGHGPDTIIGIEKRENPFLVY